MSSVREKQQSDNFFCVTFRSNYDVLFVAFVIQILDS